MASLLDTVKQNSTALSAPTPENNPLLSAAGATPSTGEATQGLAQLTAVGQTGKAVSTQGGLNTNLSALGERLASLQTLNQSKQLTQQAQLQGVSLDQQADELAKNYAQSNAQLSEQKLNAQSQYNEQVKGMLFEQSSQIKSLDLSKDKAKMEQLGTMLRMGNQKYIDQLQLEGQKARLDNSTSFNEALQRSIFSDESDLMASSMEFRNYLFADARDAQKQLADIDIEFAINVAQTQAKAASGALLWSGFAKAVSSGSATIMDSRKTPGGGTGEGGAVNPADIGTAVSVGD